MVSVACDICGQPYEFPDQLLGKLQKCRECETRFEVSEANAPIDTNREDGTSAGSGFAGFGRVLRGTAAGIAILAACAWMTALLFMDPWQRPPLEFRTHGPLKSSRPAGPTHATSSSAARPSVASPSGDTAAGRLEHTLAPPVPATPPAALPPNHMMSEERRSELNRRIEAAKNRMRNRVQPPPMPDLRPAGSNGPETAPIPQTGGGVP